jgi:hypothetical protein
MTDEAPITLIEDENSPLSFSKSGSQGQPYVYAFQIKCLNVSDEAIVVEGASFSSGVTEQMIAPSLTEKPIPPQHEFVLVGVLPPAVGVPMMENGLYFDDFRKQFGVFSVSIALQGRGTGLWVFDAAKVEEMLAAGEKALRG